MVETRVYDEMRRNEPVIPSMKPASGDGGNLCLMFIVAEPLTTPQ